MNGRGAFIRAYYEFKESVDLDQGGVLPELDELIGCMLMGIPNVPADEEGGPDAPYRAIDQRVVILKAVFVEVNEGREDAFLDRGLARYDRAARMAKKMLDEVGGLDQPAYRGKKVSGSAE